MKTDGPVTRRRRQRRIAVRVILYSLTIITILACGWLASLALPNRPGPGQYYRLDYRAWIRVSPQGSTVRIDVPLPKNVELHDRIQRDKWADSQILSAVSPSFTVVREDGWTTLRIIADGNLSLFAFSPPHEAGVWPTSDLGFADSQDQEVRFVRYQDSATQATIVVMFGGVVKDGWSETECSCSIVAGVRAGSDYRINSVNQFLDDFQGVAVETGTMSARIGSCTFSTFLD